MHGIQKMTLLNQYGYDLHGMVGLNLYLALCGLLFNCPALHFTSRNHAYLGLGSAECCCSSVENRAMRIWDLSISTRHFLVSLIVSL